MRKLIVLLGLMSVPLATHAQTGFPPFGSFESGPGDAVNRQNLNVNIPMLIVSGQGRAFGFQFAMTNNSLVWQNNAGTWSPVVGPAGSPTWGWIEAPVGFLTSVLSNGTCTYNSQQYTTHTRSSYKFTEPDGTVHPFPLSVKEVSIPDPCPAAPGYATAGYSSDNTGYYMDPNVGILYSPSGIEYGKTGAMEDTNGNYISATVVNSSETDWTDTVGHTALKFVTNASNLQFKFLDTTGAYQTTTATLQSFNVKTNFGCTGVVEYSGTASLPVSVLLPNAESYSIAYEATPQNSGYVTGRISKITFPNGGYIQYQYGTTNDGINCSDGTTTNLTRTVNDGTTSYVWQFTRALNGSNWVTTVTAPQMPYDTVANQSVFTFNSSELTSEKNYQGTTGGTLLRTTIMTWATNGTPLTTITILDDNTTQSEVETTYDSYDNLLTMKEHDYGSGAPGAVLRTTNYTYLSTTAYKNINILNRVTEKTVADSTGTIKYREDTAYDGTTISPCPTGVSQHDSAYLCSYTTRGNPTAVTTYTNAAAPSGGVTKNKYYDALGNLVQADVDCCQSEKWTFSSATQYSYPDSATTGATGGPQLTRSYTYNPYTGHTASLVDPNNQSTSYSYDIVRRRTLLTRPDNAHINWVYDDTHFTTTQSDPIQGTSVNAKLDNPDGLDRLLSTTVQDSSGTSYAVFQQQLDPLGRTYKRANVHNSTPQYWTTNQFDALNRRTKQILQDNSQTTYSYSTNTTTITDPAGHPRKYQNDGLGRMTVVFEPDPSNNNSLTLQTTYTYTVLDQQSVVTQGAQTRTYVYDDMGRLTSETNPEAGTVNNQYNSFNKITQRTDGRGVVTAYGYDTLNRLHTITYTVTGTTAVATSSVSYSYGTNAAQFNNGRLLTVTDGAGSETYSYDLLGRVTQVQEVINGNSYTVAYQYNLDGKITSLTYPSTRVVQPGYDTIGRLSSLSTGSTSLASGLTYDPSSRLTGFTYGNGITASFGFSPDRMQSQSLAYVKSGTTLFGQTAIGYSQNGGNNGEITSVTDSVDSGRSAAYSYDALDRLSSAVTTGSTNYPKWGLSWTYDRYGNRLNQSVTSGSAPMNSNTVSAATNYVINQGYTYDAGGNMTNDGVNVMTYDAENRTVTAADGSGTATYSYRASGRRVIKSFGGTTTVYVYSGDQVLAEYNNGTLAKEYIYLGRKLLATYVSGTLYYHHKDHLSARITTDSNGNKVAEQGHYPFGEDWYETGTTTTRHFTSYERDSESTNDYAIHRIYIDRLGRFSSPDPVRGCGKAPQQSNRFTYVADDAVNRVDPTGLYWMICDSDVWPVYHMACGGCGNFDVECGTGALDGGGGGYNPVPPPEITCDCIFVAGLIRFTGCSYLCECSNGTLHVQLVKCPWGSKGAGKLCPGSIVLKNGVTVFPENFCD